jgi:hypothetical protein
MPHFSDTEDVREEATRVWVEDFDDPDIVKEQDAAYAFVSAQVGPYDNTHPQIDGIRKLEQIKAAIFVLRHYSQYKDFADSKQAMFDSLLAEFKGSIAGSDISNKHATTSYKSYSAAMSENREQTEVRPHSSINPVTTMGMGLNGRREPWLKPFYFYDRVTTPRA